MIKRITNNLIFERIKLLLLEGGGGGDLMIPIFCAFWF